MQIFYSTMRKDSNSHHEKVRNCMVTGQFPSENLGHVIIPSGFLCPCMTIDNYQGVFSIPCHNISSFTILFTCWWTSNSAFKLGQNSNWAWVTCSNDLSLMTCTSCFIQYGTAWVTGLLGHWATNNGRVPCPSHIGLYLKPNNQLQILRTFQGLNVVNNNIYKSR
jgi:hypothetical protein